MKLMVFGGSFDPPHRGHATLLKAAAEKIQPDLILLVPAYRAPLKGTSFATAAMRLRLVHAGLLNTLPARWRTIARVDTGEIRSGRRIYTVDTIRRLRRSYPGAQFNFIVGADAAIRFSLWRKPFELRQRAVWWVARRPATNGQIPDFFHIIPGRMPNISSTQLRRRLELSEDVSTWLPKTVATLINDHGLYGTNLISSLRSGLSPDRYAHTLAVTRLAETLAAQHQLDVPRARLAGLLHDCGRMIPVSRMTAYARARRLKIPCFAQIVAQRPLLLHAYISADLAQHRFGVRDSTVLNAVRKHTFGAIRMSALDRVLYVADACSPDRAYREAARIRSLALQDLDAAFKACVLNKLHHALAQHAWLHPLTISLWNSLTV